MAESNYTRSDMEIHRTGRSLTRKVVVSVFSEESESEYESESERQKTFLLDPQGPVLGKWNRFLFVACVVSLFVDPLFFFLPVTQQSLCVNMGRPMLAVVLTILRSSSDACYIIQIFLRFHTAYIAPSSRVIGRGDLILDSSKIALNYVHKDFWLDTIVALPLPQALVWIVIPTLDGLSVTETRFIVGFIIVFQYVPRIFYIYQLSLQIIKTTGALIETAWAGVAYNLMFYILASHAIGACYYLLSIDRDEACWRSACNIEGSICRHGFFDCNKVNNPDRIAWFQVSNITTLCLPASSGIGPYPFGIYGPALLAGATSAKFINTYFFCFWWALRNLNCFAQNLVTTTYVGENTFAIFVASVALILFTSLIANMQTYFRSTTVRLEEWRIRRVDTEQWIHHRHLAHEVKQSVLKYGLFKWVATQGVDEEALLNDLPSDLCRNIKRHLSHDLVRRVPFFDQMDERILDAIYERLRPCLCTKGTCLVREGDPVSEMMLIIRGNLESYTTDGGRIGFFNSCLIGPGDFCGEELLTWVLDPHPSLVLPASTRTVKANCDVEVFVLTAKDLKFVVCQYQSTLSKHLRHKLRIYSLQWRTWAACYVQAAWRRYKRRKLEVELMDRENSNARAGSEGRNVHHSHENEARLSMYDAILEASARWGLSLCLGASSSDAVNTMYKPEEPDFPVK